MPLYKRKPFALVENPKDLKPQELVYQIRFTKEIFRNYDEYLKRIKLYRHKAWTCKATGKGNLTYEEALSSEKKASEKFQSIPVEYIAPIFREVQYSMLNLKDLVNSIAANMQGPFAEGDELYGKKDGRLRPCKIIKVLEDANKFKYEIAWLGSDQKMNGKASANGDQLAAKNPPFTKQILKSFVKDSTYRSLPWVLHDYLAKKHGISTDPPLELKNEISMQDGLVVYNKKRKRTEDAQNTMEPAENGFRVYKRKKLGIETSEPLDSRKTENGGRGAPSMKYPIDDLLVKPSGEDRFLTQMPSPCKEFNVQMDCVGHLLMVWDFCTSYGRLFNLSPFSLEDFESSVCHKDSTPSLLVESYSTLIQLLLNDNGKFSMAVESKKRKSKITLVTWTEHLCDFIETSCPAEFSTHISTIKRGHFALLEVDVKLAIFRELVAQSLETAVIKEKLDEFVEERQALSATRRDEALDEGRKKREEKERKKSKSAGKEVEENGKLKSSEINHDTPNGAVSEKIEKVYSRRNHSSSVLCLQKHSSRNSEIEPGSCVSDKNGKKQKVEATMVLDNGNHLSKRDIHKLMKNEIKESIEARSTEQRREYLEREIEKRYIRASPLGKDRNYCRYWFFRRDGRIFVESYDSEEWGYYQTKEELDALISSLNPKGVRERALQKQLKKFYYKICLKLQARSKDSRQRAAQEEDALVRRSTRVRAPPRENPSLAFLKYVNKWKEN